jgi:hypothetical protein
MTEIDEKFAELVKPISEHLVGRPLTSHTMVEAQYMCRQVEQELKELYLEDFEVLIGLDEINRQLVIGYRSRIPSDIIPPTSDLIHGFKRLLGQYA